MKIWDHVYMDINVYTYTDIHIIWSGAWRHEWAVYEDMKSCIYGYIDTHTCMYIYIHIYHMKIGMETRMSSLWRYAIMYIWIYRYSYMCVHIHKYILYEQMYGDTNSMNIWDHVHMDVWNINTCTYICIHTYCMNRGMKIRIVWSYEIMYIWMYRYSYIYVHIHTYILDEQGNGDTNEQFMRLLYN